ncbi:uncharacterized protein [Antedon mediterranea]|uniref:uncharacterized protein isoform X1 n=1 Tax=Antedon mediterranea TaxID=105859 RepID=UPI003AF6F8AA
MDLTEMEGNKKHDFDRTKCIFKAAVAAVKNMPQQGPFKPSVGMMKTFYGLYKQATVGPCNVNKPSYFDPVGRAKWEAWSSLADLPKEGAMLQYIEAFSKALLSNSNAANIYQFSQTLNDSPKTRESEQFIKAITPFLEALSPKINGDNSIEGDNILNGGVEHDRISDEKSDSESDEISNRLNKIEEIGDESGGAGDNRPVQHKTVKFDEDNLSSSSENEDFCDTLDEIEITEEEEGNSVYQTSTVDYNTELAAVTDFKLSTTTASNQQLLHVLENIQQDMNEMITKITKLETQLKRNLTAKQEGKVSASYFVNMTTKQIAVHAFLICVWPFVIRWFIKYIWRQKKK